MSLTLPQFLLVEKRLNLLKKVGGLLSIKVYLANTRSYSSYKERTSISKHVSSSVPSSFGQKGKIIFFVFIYMFSISLIIIFLYLLILIIITIIVYKLVHVCYLLPIFESTFEPFNFCVNRSYLIISKFYIYKIL